MNIGYEDNELKPYVASSKVTNHAAIIGKWYRTYDIHTYPRAAISKLQNKFGIGTILCVALHFNKKSCLP